MAMARKQSIQLCPVAWRPRVTRSGPSAAKAAVNRALCEDSSRPSVCGRVTQAAAARAASHAKQSCGCLGFGVASEGVRAKERAAGLLRAALKLQCEECEAVAFASQEPTGRSAQEPGAASAHRGTPLARS